jgi:hypothetical protein
VTYNQQFTKQISRKNKNPEYRILITIYILPFGFYCLFFLKNIDYIEKSMFDFLGFYNCFYIDFYFVFWCVSIDLLFFGYFIDFLFFLIFHDAYVDFHIDSNDGFNVIPSIFFIYAQI